MHVRSQKYQATIFVLKKKNRLLLTFAAYIQVHFILDFIMEPITVNPDQTAPNGAV